MIVDDSRSIYITSTRFNMTACREVPALPRSRTDATPHFAIRKVLSYSYYAAVLGYHMMKHDN